MSDPEEIYYWSRKYKYYWLYFSKILCTVFIIVVGVLFICLFYILKSKISVPAWKKLIFLSCHACNSCFCLVAKFGPRVDCQAWEANDFLPHFHLRYHSPMEWAEPSAMWWGKDHTGILCHVLFHILCLEMKASSYFLSFCCSAGFVHSS